MHNEHMKHQTYQNTVPEPCSSSVNPSGSNVWVVSAFRSGRRVQCGEMWGKEGDANSPCCLGSFGTTCRYGSEKAMAIHSSTLAWKIPWVSDAIQPPRPLLSPICFNSFFFFFWSCLISQDLQKFCGGTRFPFLLLPESVCTAMPETKLK